MFIPVLILGILNSLSYWHLEEKSKKLGGLLLLQLVVAVLLSTIVPIGIIIFIIQIINASNLRKREKLEKYNKTGVISDLI